MKAFVGDQVLTTRKSVMVVAVCGPTIVDQYFSGGEVGYQHYHY